MPLVVRTFYAKQVNGVVQSSNDMIAEATLAPEAVTKVPKAFQDAAGFTWFVTIGNSEPIKLTQSRHATLGRRAARVRVCRALTGDRRRDVKWSVRARDGV